MVFAGLRRERLRRDCHVGPANLWVRPLPHADGIIIVGHISWSGLAAARLLLEGIENPPIPGITNLSFTRALVRE